MSEQEQTCPACGAEGVVLKYKTSFECGSEMMDFRLSYESKECLHRQIATLTAENARLLDWKHNILHIIKLIPEYTSGEWAGDKDGWWFVFELIKWQTKEVASLQAIVDEAVGYLKEGKQRFGPHTTNSLVDGFIKRHDTREAAREDVK